MFLDYFALVVAIIGLILVFYTFIYIHDIPYQIAKKRNHPQTEAIHTACWLSVFTLHALWPLVFIWAVSKPSPIAVTTDLDRERESALNNRIAALEAELTQIKGALTAVADRARGSEGAAQ